MKKDLQRLRETDVVLESEKIVGAKITKNISAPAPQKPAPEIQKTLKEFQPPAIYPLPENPTLPNERRGDSQKISKVSSVINSIMGGLFSKGKKEKQPAQKPVEIKSPERNEDETERQQIFLLKSRRTELENQVSAINKEKWPFLLSKKNKVLAKKAVWQKKLDSLIKEEKPETEEQKQNIDRRKWPAEKEMANIEKEIAGIDENYEKIGTEEDELKKKIERIDASLKEIYSAIAKRENEKRATAPIVDALEKTEKTEEERRKNFLENIEKWASGSKNNKN